MESYNEKSTLKSESKSNITGRVAGGILLIIVGAIFLLDRTGFDIPNWLFSWEIAMVGIGLYIGFRHSFRGALWVVFVLIGGFMLVDDFIPTLDVDRFLWPLLIIAVGVVMIFRPQLKTRPEATALHPASQNVPVTDGNDQEIIDSVAILGGIKRNIISKNFRGGEAVTVLGGTELNLSQADSPGVIMLELTQIFGGTKLIVPPHWKILSDDMVCILGGVDDKRPIYQPAATEESQRILIIKGTCIFGGIDIKSF